MCQQTETAFRCADVVCKSQRSNKITTRPLNEPIPTSRRRHLLQNLLRRLSILHRTLSPPVPQSHFPSSAIATSRSPFPAAESRPPAFASTCTSRSCSAPSPQTPSIKNSKRTSTDMSPPHTKIRRFSSSTKFRSASCGFFSCRSTTWIGCSTRRNCGSRWLPYRPPDRELMNTRMGVSLEGMFRIHLRRSAVFPRSK